MGAGNHLSILICNGLDKIVVFVRQLYPVLVTHGHVLLHWDCSISPSVSLVEQLTQSCNNLSLRLVHPLLVVVKPRCCRLLRTYLAITETILTVPGTLVLWLKVITFTNKRCMLDWWEPFNYSSKMDYIDKWIHIIITIIICYSWCYCYKTMYFILCGTVLV